VNRSLETGVSDTLKRYLKIEGAEKTKLRTIELDAS
jgi:hypothetical protein